jgi:alanine dehydrogenase
MITSKEALESLALSGVLMPQEEMLEVSKKSGKLYIGIPKERAYQERRVPLVPEAVALLVNNGHRVVVESGAGEASNFVDNQYSEAGAEITPSINEVYKADIVLTVAPPSLECIDLMHPKQTIISALQLVVQPKDYLKKMMAKRVSAVAWDFIKDEDGIFPIVRAMGEIAGNTSVLIAAEYLSNTNNGNGLMFGGISGVPPTEVVILGAGTVGEYATRSSVGLGASVKVFDNSVYRLRRLQNNIGTRIHTSTIQPNELKKALGSADVVIGALRAQRGSTPCVVNEDMVHGMKEGAVIVDVSIDQGGCFETSKATNHDKPTFVKHGVIHYCVPNIASRVSRTASHALSNIFASIIMDIGDEGGIGAVIKKYAGIRNGVYMYNGALTNQYLGEAFNLPYKNLNLLMTAF